MEKEGKEKLEQNNEVPHVDFSMQLSLNKDSEQVEASIFECLQDIAGGVEAKLRSPLGALIVLGDFERYGPQIKGMAQMKPKQNPVESMIIITAEDAIDYIIEYSISPFDGAIVVNRTGQVLGAGIYLVVDNPLLETPDDCGTRHKAAASFSERNDVISVLTLSEETNTVRLWKNGRTTRVFRIGSEKNKEKEKQVIE